MKNRFCSRCFKIMVTVLILCLTLSCFSGCNSASKKSSKKSSKTQEAVTYRFVVLDKEDEVTEESLGDIRTDGDFTQCDSHNMLKYEGFYQGNDFVTLVFDESSKIDVQNVEMFVSERNWISSYLEGVLYRCEDGKKYVEYKFETLEFEHEEGMVPFDSVGRNYLYKLPTVKSEPMSYYSIMIKHGQLDPGYDCYVAECTQTSSIEQSYWTDYTYDMEIQYYHADTGKWETEKEKDCMTDNMPLE